MSDLGGSTLDQKQIWVSHGAAATAVATLAEALGHRVARGSGAGHLDLTRDLTVVEATTAEDLADVTGSAPILVVASRRLRPGQVQGLQAAGAHRVLDADACLLEVAFAMTDLLFETRCDQRRYAEHFARIEVAFCDEDGEAGRGRLTGLSQCGGQVMADLAPAEGTMVTLNAEIGTWAVPIRGRVAFADRALRPGFGVEFALDDECLAPRLDAFLAEAAPAAVVPRRSASGISA